MTKPVRRVIGIDPGSRITGYGIIDAGSPPGYVASGCIRTGSGAFAARLGEIYQSVCQLIETHQPEALAIEDVFVARNVDSALKLGQARGVAIAAGVAYGLDVHEYGARTVKRAVVGTGRAGKDQVQHMIRTILKLPAAPQADAADALAIAICHVNTSRLDLQ